MKRSFRLAAVVTGLILGLIMWVLTPRVHAAVAHGIDCENLANRAPPALHRPLTAASLEA